jgi:polygalacturonase
MGFFLSKAEKDIWMRDKGDHYEYRHPSTICVSPSPSSPRRHTSSFKLKDRTYKFHLGCDFVRDEHGRLGYAPIKYIEKMVANYERIFGQKPRNAVLVKVITQNLTVRNFSITKTPRSTSH